MRALALPTLLLLITPALAQKAEPAPTGTVTGHVLFADTRQPARLVEVTLARRPDKAEAEAEARMFTTGKPPERKAPTVTTISSRTGLDGAFLISAVPPGEYYALSKPAGYLLPIAPITDEKTAEDPDLVMRDIPRVLVKVNATAEVNLELHRGATLSGRVQFEDGAPVPEVFVHAEDAEVKTQYLSLRPYYLQRATENQSDRVLTDSEGHFSIVGIRPGKYTILATVTTSGGYRTISDGRTSNYRYGRQGAVQIPVYASAAFRRKDAQVFEIKGSERIGDVTIELRLSAVHTVSGRVVSQADRHAPSYAYLALIDKEDKLFRREAQLQLDGSFQFNQIPPGTYTLLIENAREVAEPDNLEDEHPTTVLRKFVDTEVPVLLLDNDLSLPIIALDEQKPAAPKP